jgi:hypothetical protein
MAELVGAEWVDVCEHRPQSAIASLSRFSLLFEHDPFGKPVPTPHQVRGRLFRIML